MSWQTTNSDRSEQAGPPDPLAAAEERGKAPAQDGERALRFLILNHGGVDVAESFRSETGYAPVRGGKLYYEVAGAGHPLLLTHAGIADHRMWDEQFPVFAERYRVIRYDTRGYGRSSAAQAPFAFHEDIHDLLVHLGVTRAHVLGLSMGGAASVAFTIVHPEMVTALVAVAAGSDAIKAPAEMLELWNKVGEHCKNGAFDEANELELQLWVDGPRRTPAQVNPAVRERVRVMKARARLGRSTRRHARGSARSGRRR
jgi:pimeloyl-ACP methyl ester carboxylesterase